MKRRRKKRRILKGLGLFLILILLGSAYILYGRLFPLEHEETISFYAKEYGVDPFLVYGLIHTESRFRADAVSPAGAKGLMQITDDTGEFIARHLDMTDYSEEMLFEPDISIRMGIWYLSYLRESFPVKETALAAYNAGPGRVKAWLKDEDIGEGDILLSIPYEETRNYVERVSQREKIYRTLFFWK